MAVNVPSKKLFTAISQMDMSSIADLSLSETRIILPFLTRMVICNPLDNSQKWIDKRQQIQKILSDIEAVNNIVALLSSDFHNLEIDAKREQQLKSKLMGGHSTESVLVSSLADGLALEFEKADGIRKIRLLLSELISLMTHSRNMLANNSAQQIANPLRASEIFDNDVYFDDVSDVLCIAIAELPNTIQLTETVEALLYVKNGPALICRLVANAPESFHEVCLTLLNNGEKQDEESLLGRIRMQALRLLCQMNPSHSLTVRTEAVELCKMPGLTVMLTLDFVRKTEEQNNYAIGEFVSFISSMLFGNDEKVKLWFAQYIRNGQKRMDQMLQTSLSSLRTELLGHLNFLIQNIENASDNVMVQASHLIRVYCALKTVASMKFSEEETGAVISLVTCHPPPTTASVRFVSLGLCMLLACPQLINGENEKKAIAWINWLIKDESYFGRIANVSSSFCEMLLLVAIHFHGNQIQAINELVSSTIGIKLAIRQNNLIRIKMIFTQEIFTDQVVTAHAVKVPVTLNLNSHVTGFLPVHCIYQLLKSRAFTKHKVPIKEWILKQICNATGPIHPIFPPLIEVYVNSIIIPSSKNATHTNEPISEQSILKVFQFNVYAHQEDVPMEVDQEFVKCPVTSQLLLLYYVLLYEDVRLSHMKNIVMTDRKVTKYSREFIAQLPIFYLLQKTRIEQENYGVLFPPLLRVISLHYPHLCLVQDWLVSEKKTLTKRIITPNSVKEERQNFLSSFNSNASIIVTLERFLSLPKDYLWPLAPEFVSKLPILFSSSTPKLILEKMKKLWWMLNSIFPRKLWVMTVNTLRPKLFPFSNQGLTWTDIVLDPLHVLRCDERVFRNPVLMEINLHILNAFLAASRIYLSHHLLERPSKNAEEEKDREELRIALLAAQESAAVQILLECCIPNEESEQTREVNNLICSHLHQTFILDPNIAKLVHFQGYPSQLLPLVVAGIPSMHICLDFIPELLSQPDLSKQAFAIELCSYLCKHYAIVKSLSVAKLCFNVSLTLLSILPSQRRTQFFISVIPALVRMCNPFPPLCDDALKLLIQLSQVNMSYLASSSPHFMFPESSLKLLSNSIDELDWDELVKYFAKLPSDDPLCLTIKNSFEELSRTK